MIPSFSILSGMIGAYSSARSRKNPLLLGRFPNKKSPSSIWMGLELKVLHRHPLFLKEHHFPEPQLLDQRLGHLVIRRQVLHKMGVGTNGYIPVTGIPVHPQELGLREVVFLQKQRVPVQDL